MGQWENMFKLQLLWLVLLPFTTGHPFQRYNNGLDAVCGACRQLWDPKTDQCDSEKAFRLIKNVMAVVAEDLSLSLDEFTLHDKGKPILDWKTICSTLCSRKTEKRTSLMDSFKNWSTYQISQLRSLIQSENMPVEDEYYILFELDENEKPASLSQTLDGFLKGANGNMKKRALDDRATREGHSEKTSDLFGNPADSSSVSINTPQSVERSKNPEIINKKIEESTNAPLNFETTKKPLSTEKIIEKQASPATKSPPKAESLTDFESTNGKPFPSSERPSTTENAEILSASVESLTASKITTQTSAITDNLKSLKATAELLAESETTTVRSSDSEENLTDLTKTGQTQDTSVDELSTDLKATTTKPLSSSDASDDARTSTVRPVENSADSKTTTKSSSSSVVDPEDFGIANNNPSAEAKVSETATIRSSASEEYLADGEKVTQAPVPSIENIGASETTEKPSITDEGLDNLEETKKTPSPLSQHQDDSEITTTGPNHVTDGEINSETATEPPSGGESQSISETSAESSVSSQKSASKESSISTEPSPNLETTIMNLVSTTESSSVLAEEVSHSLATEDQEAKSTTTIPLISTKSPENPKTATENPQASTESSSRVDATTKKPITLTPLSPETGAAEHTSATEVEAISNHTQNNASENEVTTTNIPASSETTTEKMTTSTESSAKVDTPTKHIPLGSEEQQSSLAPEGEASLEQTPKNSAPGDEAATTSKPEDATDFDAKIEKLAENPITVETANKILSGTLDVLKRVKKPGGPAIRNGDILEALIFLRNAIAGDLKIEISHKSTPESEMEAPSCSSNKPVSPELVRPKLPAKINPVTSELGPKDNSKIEPDRTTKHPKITTHAPFELTTSKTTEIPHTTPSVSENPTTNQSPEENPFERGNAESLIKKMEQPTDLINTEKPTIQNPTDKPLNRGKPIEDPKIETDLPKSTEVPTEPAMVNKLTTTQKSTDEPVTGENNVEELVNATTEKLTVDPIENENPLDEKTAISGEHERTETPTTSPSSEKPSTTQKPPLKPQNKGNTDEQPLTETHKSTENPLVELISSVTTQKPTEKPLNKGNTEEKINKSVQPKSTENPLVEPISTTSQPKTTTSTVKPTNNPVRLNTTAGRPTATQRLQDSPSVTKTSATITPISPIQLSTTTVRPTITERPQENPKITETPTTVTPSRPIELSSSTESLPTTQRSQKSPTATGTPSTVTETPTTVTPSSRIQLSTTTVRPTTTERLQDNPTITETPTTVTPVNPIELSSSTESFATTRTSQESPTATGAPSMVTGAPTTVTPSSRIQLSTTTVRLTPTERPQDKPKITETPTTVTPISSIEFSSSTESFPTTRSSQKSPTATGSTVTETPTTVTPVNPGQLSSTTERSQESPMPTGTQSTVIPSMPLNLETSSPKPIRPKKKPSSTHHNRPATKKPPRTPLTTPKAPTNPTSNDDDKLKIIIQHGLKEEMQIELFKNGEVKNTMSPNVPSDSFLDILFNFELDGKKYLDRFKGRAVDVLKPLIESWRQK